jgi:hypothetical protein
MANARRETTSAEQLVELRKARDRYKALADQFREEGDAVASQFQSEGDPLAVMEEKLKRERDARRIANAYEKSIANIVASSSLMSKAHTSAPSARSIAARLVVLVVFLVAASAAVLAFWHPEFYRRALAHLPNNWGMADHPAPIKANTNTNVSAPPIVVAPVPSVPEKKQPALIAPRPTPSRARVIDRAAPKKPSVSRTDKVAGTSDPAASDDDGFVAKVLQPDGTFKEQHFSAKPRR